MGDDPKCHLLTSNNKIQFCEMGGGRLKGVKMTFRPQGDLTWVFLREAGYTQIRGVHRKIVRLGNIASKAKWTIHELDRDCFISLRDCNDNS